MIGVGIESTCDETSIGITREGDTLLSLKLYSQIELHKKYRGVVPEIASRAHLEKINLLLEEAIQEAGVGFADLAYVSVSAYPGLMGALIIGAQMARCLAMALGIPVVPVDHLEAHMAAIRLEGQRPEFPYLGVLLSGGNSAVYIVHGFGKMEVVGDTMDDALGEAFDKVAALLDLSYPGGPPVEEQAKQYLPASDEKQLFPELLRDLPRNEVKFSYSGLKTSVLYYTKKNDISAKQIPKICYHFQNTAFQLVEKNLKRAVAITGVKRIVAAGGVLANQTLRDRLHDFSLQKGWDLFTPIKRILCTDNGAMVACLGYHLLQLGKSASLDFRVSPSRQVECS
ncbi:MAG: tRNA (adenosine(37)-N6)-threonylcarbamoyltransferase complex transferase subunit TsaD [Spirochaetota bacterium]